MAEQTHAAVTIALLPCPFCGGTDIRPNYIRDGYAVRCWGCAGEISAFNPNALSHAQTKWNKRPVDTAEVEKLRVQLAGCGVAAEGGTTDDLVAAEGAYGWSKSYQAVLGLRRNYDALMVQCGLSSARAKS